MKTSLAITLLGSCALLVGACTTDLQKSQAAPPPTGSEFNRDLSGYYRGMAPNQWDGQSDFQASERFARKSMAAGRGETVQPDNVVANGPGVKLEPELEAARARLMTALGGDASTRLPNTTARAQASFDCWLDEASDPVQAVEGAWLESKVQNCRDAYYSAMNEIEKPRTVASVAPTPAPVATPVARQQAYITFFGFNEATV